MAQPPQRSAWLPPPYPDRLAYAAAMKDFREIDRITDELARRCPHLVRRRSDGSMFGSLAAEAAFRG